MICHIPTSIYHNCFINGLLANQITALIISPSISLTHVLWTQTFPTTTKHLFHLFSSPLLSHTYTHWKNSTRAVTNTSKQQTLLVFTGNLSEWIVVWWPRYNKVVITQFWAELWKRNSQHKAISTLASNLRRKNKNWQTWKENHLSHLYWEKKGLLGKTC